MSNTSQFVKLILAQLTGDQDTVLAVKNEKLATSALNTQIALREGELVEAETALEEAKERMTQVTFPVTLVDRSSYVQLLLNTKNKVQEKEDAMELIEETLKFLKSTLKSFK